MTVSLLGGVGVLVLVAGVTIDVVVGRSLQREFDRALEAKARALITLTEQEAGSVEFDFAAEVMPEFESPTDPHYFELWLDGTELLERSNSFELSTSAREFRLPRQPGLISHQVFSDSVLPDGREGRVVRMDFVPQVDTPDEDETVGIASDELSGEESPFDSAQAAPASGLLVATIVVARERESLDGQALGLRRLVVGLTLSLLAAVVVLVRVSLRSGLRPLKELASAVGDLREDSLDQRIELEALPRELESLVDRFNGSLDRLDAAFRREKQLTGDLAHELRTPIAELRSICAVGVRWPEDTARGKEFFADARAVSLQMERIVSQLLELARYDEGAQVVARGRVWVSAVVAAAWEPLRRTAEARNLGLENRVKPESVLETDGEKLHLVLTNVLSNAVAFSRPGTEIGCRFEERGSYAALTISNYAENLDQDDLPDMFDRFWRKDRVRSSGGGVGLGLAIVRSVATRLGFEIDTSLAPDGLFELTFRTHT